MIRILYVHHGKGIGGAPLSLLYLIRGLDRSRFFPTVLCLYESEAVDLFRREGIETHVARRIHDFSHTNVSWYGVSKLPKAVYRFLHLPFAIERARRFLQKREFDIVHLNTSTLLAFGIAAHREGMKVVWHVREPIHRGYCGLRRRLIRAVIDRNADVIIPICRYDADQLIPSEKISVVYNFIDFAQFHPMVSGEHLFDSLRIDRGADVVIMLGGVNPIKGSAVFARAAGLVRERFPHAVFLIAGPIPDRSIRNWLNGTWRYYRSLRSFMEESGLSRTVRLLGTRSDIPALLSISAILCFPSTVPHFARPIIEASAMGVPVIASGLGGPRELVEDGKTGILVTPEDPEALADAIGALLQDGKRRKSFGERGIELARERFSAERNIAHVVGLYEAVMGT